MPLPSAVTDSLSFLIELPMLWNDYCTRLLRLQELMVAVSAVGIAFTASGAITIACSQSWMGSADVETLRKQATFLVVSTIIFIYSMVSAWFSRLLRLFIYGDEQDASSVTGQGTRYEAHRDDVANDWKGGQNPSYGGKLYAGRFQIILVDARRMARERRDSPMLPSLLAAHRRAILYELVKLSLFWILDIYAFIANMVVLLGPIAGILVALYPLMLIVNIDLEWFMIALLLSPAGVTALLVYARILLNQYEKMVKEDEKKATQLAVQARADMHRGSEPDSQATAGNPPFISQSSVSIALHSVHTKDDNDEINPERKSIELINPA